MRRPLPSVHRVDSVTRVGVPGRTRRTESEEGEVSEEGQGPRPRSSPRRQFGRVRESRINPSGPSTSLPFPLFMSDYYPSDTLPCVPPANLLPFPFLDEFLPPPMTRVVTETDCPRSPFTRENRGWVLPQTLEGTGSERVVGVVVQGRLVRHCDLCVRGPEILGGSRNKKFR